jgi:hypothetical protein
MKFRFAEWFDTDSLTIKYGVQAQRSKGVWLNCAENGELIIFEKREEALAKAKELSAKAAE